MLSRKLLQAGDAANLTPQTADYIAAMSVAPDATREGHIDTLIAGLIDDGVWAKLDWLSLYAAHDAQAARLNAVNPAQSFSVTGSPSFSTDLGYQGVSTTGYLTSGWDASNNGVNYTRDSACIGAWSLTEYNGAGDPVGNATARINPRNGGQTQTAINESFPTGTMAGPGTSVGLFVGNRNGSTAGGRAVYHNATSYVLTGGASIALTTHDFYGCGYNNSGSAQVDSSRRYAAVFWGGSLDATEQTAIYNRLSTYLTAVGAI